MSKYRQPDFLQYLSKWNVLITWHMKINAQHILLLRIYFIETG